MAIILSRRAAMGGLAGAMLSAGGVGAVARDGPETTYFSYFAGGDDQTPGLRLAVSGDGMTFTALRDGAIFLVPDMGEKQLMRDPFLMRSAGPGGSWHLLWTTAWEGVTLGHATSPDLVRWSPQRAIPVMRTVRGTRNVWAPEAIWDAATKRYVIFWSSTVRGRFPETDDASENGYNHRLWCVTTRDFRTFSDPEVLWDPGFSVIDATFLDHPRLGLHIIVKDETLKPAARKHLRIARAATPRGPFGPLSKPISPDWVEGPTTLMLGEWTYVYFDRYAAGGWGAIRSRDLVNWEDVTGGLSMPPGARHGTAVRGPTRYRDRIVQDWNRRNRRSATGPGDTRNT